MAVVAPEEYLRLERAAEWKSEYIDGCIVPMPHVSLVHCLITGNVGAVLHSEFKNRPCIAMMSQMRVYVERAGMYAYPDVAAVCEKPHTKDAHNDNLLNPMLIVEVLSPASEARDRGIKFQYYRKLESLQEFIFIDQHQPFVERYELQNGFWILKDFRGLDAVVELSAVACWLPLREVYDGIEFPT
jgi:Uma2 family endonuclease